MGKLQVSFRNGQEEFAGDRSYDGQIERGEYLCGRARLCELFESGACAPAERCKLAVADQVARSPQQRFALSPRPRWRLP